MIGLILGAATGAFNRVGPALLGYILVALAAFGLLVYAHHAGAVSAERDDQIQVITRRLDEEKLRAETIANDKLNVENAFSEYVIASAAESKTHSKVSCAIQAAPDRRRLAPSTISRLKAIRGER